MSFCKSLSALVALLLFITQTSAQGGARVATVQVDAAKRAGYKIPRTIYGTFLEPIGNSIYGGLWAQALENPSFEENLWSVSSITERVKREPALLRASELGLPLPWEPLESAQGARYEPRWMDSANSARSLLIMALPKKQTGVRQQVYLPTYRTLRYTGSIYAKHLSGSPVLEVSLRARNRPERAYVRQQIQLAGRDWRRYEFALELSANQLAPLEPADFVIALTDEGRALLDQAFLYPADHVDGMDPEMIKLSRELRTPVVRYGGNFTSAYHWGDGIGPIDKRVSMLNVAWGIPEYNHFGTDEFLRFCQLIDAEPQIALNLGSGTPEEAAGWVEYVNRRWNDGKGGLLWELGNELWGDFQVGYPTLLRVAERTRAFSQAVRRVDRKTSLIATGADPDNFEKWNAAQLADAPGAYDYLATHFVVTTSEVQKRNAPPEFVAEAAFALPVELERRLRSMERQLGSDQQARGKVKVAFTEWLFWSRDERAPYYHNMGGAICTAGMLNALLRAADFVPISNMTGLIEFGGIWKKRGRVYAVPAYWAFRMYSNADAVIPVEARIDVDEYDITEGVRRLPNIADVPYLDVVAALNEAGDRLTLFCVNRHLTRDIRARISLAGFNPDAEARVQKLSAASIYESNSEINPDEVRPVERALRVESRQFDLNFERSSVTVIELRRQRRG